MSEEIISSATNMFTGGTVLLGISLVILVAIWRTLVNSIKGLPENQRKLRIKLMSINNKKQKVIEEMKTGLYFGCIFFGLSVFTSTIAFYESTAIMLDFNFTSIDYNLAK